MDETFQRIVPYNRFLPYGDAIDQDASNYLDEIKRNLKECLITKPLDTSKVALQVVNVHKYIVLYGLRFTKADHVFIIQTLYGLFTTKNMDPLILDQLAKVLVTVLKKKYLLSRKDLQLDWKPLFDLYFHYEDSSGAMRSMVKGIIGLKQQIISVIKFSRAFFSDSATREMLDRWRPLLCPFDRSITTGLKYFELFLPSTSDIPKELTYGLWREEFMTLWESFGNSPSWEVDLFRLYARLAHHNIGRIDWEPYNEIIFTRIMATFCLPVTYGQSGIKVKFGLSGSGAFPTIARWIVSVMGGEGNSTQLFLTKMLLAIESYYYPANDSPASEGLHSFIALICTYFINRVHLERYNTKWKSKTPDDKKLTDENITSFVKSLIPISFHILFNNYEEERRNIFNILATLRPELIIPPLLEKAFNAIETVTEPHRLTACVATLSACSRPLVENYPMDVIRLLNELLPGIDVNDIWKSTDIFILMSDLLEMIWLVDFSDPSLRVGVQLSEAEEEFLNKTAMFEDFVVSFTDQCLTLIENTSREQTRHETDVMEESMNDEEIAADAAITDTFQKIMYRSSPKIFKLAFNKLKSYVEERILEPCVAGTILASMCKSTVAVQPQMALEFFIPHFSGKVSSILSERLAHPHQKTHQKIDHELQFALLLLSEVISIRGLSFITSPGTVLLDHMTTLIELLDKTLHLDQKDEYEISSTILQNIIVSLVHIRPKQTLKTHTELNWSREVYAWAKPGDLDKLKIEWYVPGKRELDAAHLLLQRYLKPNLDALTRLARGEQQMEKEEVMRRLRLLYKISHGASELLPPLQAKPFSSCLSNNISMLNDLYLTIEGKPVRQTIMEVLRSVQAYLLANSSDDTDSLSTIITIYDVLLLSFGLDEDDLNDHMEDLKTIKSHRLNRLVRSKRHLESILVDRVVIQHETHLWLKNLLTLEVMPEETINDIFTLSTSRYSEVRTFAQELLIKLMARTAPEGHEMIIKKLTPLLQNSPDVTHQQLKGALYIIWCEKLCFFYNWKSARAIMPALVKAQHSDKTSVVDILKDISIKCNRMYTDFVLFTLPIKKPKISPELLRRLGLSGNEDMECDEDDDEEDPDYLALEKELCSLICDGTLHWRHKQMAIGMMLSIIVEDHIQPPEVVDMWLQCLVDDDRTVRLVSFHALECILKLCKRKRKRVFVKMSDNGPIECEQQETNHTGNGDSDTKNGFAEKGLVADGAKVRPGLRPDNLWMQYNSQMTDKELAEYWDRPFTVKPGAGYYAWSKPKVKVHVTDETSLEKPEYIRSLFIAFFTDSEKLDKYFKLNCLEHKKGEDFFSMDKGLFYSTLLENFGPDPILKLWLPYMHKLAESHQEADQRVVSELVYGVLRGSRYWSFASVQELWKEMSVLFRTIFNNITDETIADWETCLSGVTNKADPNRLRWLYEFLVTDAEQSLTSPQHGAFKESSFLRLLNKSLMLNWKVRELYQRSYRILQGQLSHSYNKVRRQIASTVATLHSMDIEYDNGAYNFGVGFPTRNSFIDEVLPRLELNFHNPELNGIGKQNGTAEAANGNLVVFNEASNSSSMDVDAVDSPADKERKKENANLLETVAIWLIQYIQVSSTSPCSNVYNLLPFFCQFVGYEADQEVSQSCLKALCFLSVCIVPVKVIPFTLDMAWKVLQSTSWKARISILEFLQVFVFTNFMSMCNNPDIVKKTENLIVNLTADENLQVRQKASKILGGLVHSQFLDSEAQKRLLQYFRSLIRSKMTRGNKKSKFQKTAKTEDKVQLATFHAGILGLCAFVEAYPYDVPEFVPEILIELEKHLHDPQPIPKTIKNTFQEFKRTHMDNWSEHKQKFTDEQLNAMTDLLVSPNYYA